MRTCHGLWQQSLREDPPPSPHNLESFGIADTALPSPKAGPGFDHVQDVGGVVILDPGDLAGVLGHRLLFDLKGGGDIYFAIIPASCHTATWTAEMLIFETFPDLVML